MEKYVDGIANSKLYSNTANDLNRKASRIHRNLFAGTCKISTGRRCEGRTTALFITYLLNCAGKGQSFVPGGKKYKKLSVAVKILMHQCLQMSKNSNTFPSITM